MEDRRAQGYLRCKLRYEQSVAAMGGIELNTCGCPFQHEDTEFYSIYDK